MQIVLCESVDHVGARAADIIEARVRRGPAVLGLATGGSPSSTYQELIRRHREEQLSFGQVTGFTLDEYAGLPKEHGQSYYSTIRREFVDQVGLPLERLFTPQGDAADLVAEAERYDAAIAAAGGVDIQILGIGANGHIGFNEPTSSLASRTRVKTLAGATRTDNARFFPDGSVPRLCLTQGLGTILEAKLAVLVAMGENKAAAVQAMVEGPVSANCPASVLQLHRRAVVLLDPAAASRLSMLEYYRDAQEFNDQLGQTPTRPWLISSST
ncbi:glucosamine-6-phosphate deaminase [Pseudarthrobacter sp. NBSH8]|uniref:glucosamine-6-phosphate deaminase n=1 Tax=Pseudarthrobacter sp. NBSH8 TaxID=2596911 RepID=UPI001626D243|nr:glucosamine-6-phosphate deaminase [Pseudarthrobacter sp. NBSH8]QNE14515.1 glucosamine-6-phosphate deaminase [Pseudarthrobacter sp. NBSH8]